MKAWQINELGDPWTKLTIAEVALPKAPETVCRVEVEAVDLNFAEILQCQGSYQVKLTPPFTPGMYAVGRVVEAGAAAGHGVGDRIFGPAYKGYGSYAQECFLIGTEATKLATGIDPVQVVAMHVTYSTAWFGLHHRGQLQPGETVLVLAAAGGVGAAAVELAKLHGCRVIAAAGGSEKTDACLQMGADEAVDYNSEDLYEKVMALTDGQGVNVVYDPVGAHYFDIAKRLIAWEGRYLIIGFAAGTIPSAPLNHALVKNYSLVGVHMGGYRGRDDQPLTACYDELYKLLLEERINPLVDAVIGFDQLPMMMKRLADRKSKGRSVFDPRL